jgi:tripeptidyl-peptidase-2
LAEQGDTLQAFSVKGGSILEVVIAKWWASIGDSPLNYRITFCGLRPNQLQPVMHAAEGLHRIDVSSGLKFEDLSPSIALKHQIHVLRPTEHKLVTLGSRDRLPEGRQIYELQLTYAFHIAKACDVTPGCPILSDVLYESEFESQLWMIFDCNKQLLVTGDAYPYKYTSKLEKGDYILRMHVRHEKREMLEKLSDKSLLLQHKLASSISMDVFPTYSAAVTGGKKFSSCTLQPGMSTAVYIPALPTDKLPKNGGSASMLTGTISYAKDEIGRKADVYPFKYILTDSHKRSKSEKSESKEKEKDKEQSKEEEFTEAVRDLKIVWVAKLEPGGAGRTLYEDLKKDHGDHLPLHVSRIQALDNDKDRLSHLQQIIEVADIIIAAVDQLSLLAYYGAKTDPRPDANKFKSTMDKQKAALLEALTKKGSALCDMRDMCPPSDGPGASGEGVTTSHTPSLEDIEAIFTTVQRFAEMTDSKVWQFSVKYYMTRQQFGRALKIVFKQFEDKPSQEQDDKLVTLFRKLGWQHCADMWESSAALRFPSSYHPF